MLDLKAKLLAAGLVTEDQVARVEEQKKRDQERHARKSDGPRGPTPARARDDARRPPRERRPPKPEKTDDERWAERVAKLAAAPKSEQYEVLRGWVERTRRDDPKALPSEQAERFHFQKGDGSIGWVTVEPDLKAALSDGLAAVVHYIGFNGGLHAVVPREVALDIHKVRPEWLRALANFEFELLPIATPRKRTKKKAGAVDGAPGEGDASEGDASEGDAGEVDASASDASAVAADRAAVDDVARADQIEHEDTAHADAEAPKHDEADAVLVEAEPSAT